MKVHNEFNKYSSRVRAPYVSGTVLGASGTKVKKINPCPQGDYTLIEEMDNKKTKYYGGSERS